MRVALLAIAAWAAAAGSAGAQEMVSITVPPAVSFLVTNVSSSTTGSPIPTTFSFASANLDLGKSLRVSVQADASTFTPPSGSRIPASKVTWRILGAAGGVGSNGTLNSTSYTLVYQTNPNPTSGQVNLEWTLAPPGNGIRAGAHQLAIRWKVESITP